MKRFKITCKLCKRIQTTNIREMKIKLNGMKEKKTKGNPKSKKEDFEKTDDEAEYFCRGPLQILFSNNFLQIDLLSLHVPSIFFRVSIISTSLQRALLFWEHYYIPISYILRNNHQPTTIQTIVSLLRYERQRNERMF